MPTHGARYSLEAGQIFEQNYRIVRELGRGGFGVIYLAHQLSMDRPVALKILKPGVGRHDPNARDRFLREVKIISRLRHPNTVTIHDYGESGEGIVYMVLEYVEGTTLKDALRREGAQPLMKALGIARQIARSLDEAHRHGIIHRDLKPDNIMLTNLEADADFVKVLDFGVARLRSSEDVDLTQAGVPDGERALIGTPRYMSPEQVRGGELSAASDLYSLGLMLYEMLIGTPAVQGDTSMALISQQISPEPLDLSELSALHPRLQDLLRRATDKEVERRFQTGTEIADAIDETARRISAEKTGNGGDAQQFFATSGRFSPVTASESQKMEALDRRSEPEDDNPDWVEQGFSAADFSSEHQGRADTSGPNGASGGRPPECDADSTDTSAVFVDDTDNIDDESRLLGIPSAELPDAPDTKDSPFAPSPKLADNVDASASTNPGSQRDSAGTNGPDEDSESGLKFGFVVGKLCFLGSLAAFFVYTAFLVVGAIVGTLTDGPLRFAAAISIGIAIPLFTALGENSQKERFEVITRLTDRIGRVFIGSSFFAAASIVIICFAMPVQVTDQLRSEPNWMFDDNKQRTAAVNLNENLSYIVANGVQRVTYDLGWTGVSSGEPRDSAEIRPGTPGPVGPPEPTRPGTRGDAPQPDDDHVPPQGPPASDSEDSTDSDDDDDYVNW